MVVQKQKIAFAKRMQHRQINLLPGAPELVDKWLGIELAIKRQEQSDRVSHNHRGPRHHAGGGLLGKMRLLFSRKCTTTLANKLTDILA